jgi:molybdopterin synthase catalytic subunit
VEVDYQVSQSKKEILLSHVALDTSKVEREHHNDAVGAVVLFVGTVRGENPGNKVLRLEFEAYEPMAISEIEKIFSRVEKQWDTISVILHHRLGSVDPGEPAVIVGVKSRHRKNAFEACAFIMDELKRTVPIWKKEVFENGETWVSSTP